jgi:hypothetical protein
MQAIPYILVAGWWLSAIPLTALLFSEIVTELSILPLFDV